MTRNLRRMATGLTLTVLVSALVSLSPTTVRAQSAAEQALLQKAHSQEQSGHIDLAAQTWQQILLSNPNNQEALAGLGRWAKLSGNDAEAETYIDRLRTVNPNSPEVAKIEALVSNKTQNELLGQAAELAKNGHNEEALKIYRQTFGTHPPDNWALAYYDTEAGIPAELPDAIAGLRRLAAKYPSDPQYTIDLGRVLTYDPRTRAEGEKILSQYPQDPTAQTALRTALGWDVQNPATIPAVREYLKQHPDPELAKELAETEAQQSTAGIARTPAEREAFDELAKSHLDRAQQLFVDLSVKQPTNPRALAGLGFVRMKQSNFGEAAQYFEQAQQNGLKSPLIAQSLATARFWNAMQQGTQALNANRLDEAVKQYQAALALRPGNIDALSGEAGAYMRMQAPDLAVPVYQALLHRQPKADAWWRGLFSAQAQAGQGRDAILTGNKFPPGLKKAVARDPDYLRMLARAYAAAGQKAQAQQTLVTAMNLKYPAGEEKMRTEITLQYAALLAEDKEYAQSQDVYRRVLRADPNNIDAWQGLVSMQHLAGHDGDAIAVVERMPPDAYDSALRNGGFLSELAAIYENQNHPEIAQNFLERAVKVYESSGQALPMSLQLQVAGLDLERNHAQGAYNIYRGVLTQHPENVDAWKGLMAALHATDHDADAMAQIQQIPAAVRKQLATDPEYLQTLAAIYAANGDDRGALGLLSQVEDAYHSAGRQAPASADIANAWTLMNLGDDRDLYRQLMTLGDRTDMSDEQRRQVQTIWATWAQRRAARASAAGNTRRAVEILTAAAQAFPGNPAVSKALAAGFVQAGQPKDAMAIYQSLDMSNAAASDYQSMVGAALGAQNTKQAETWLRQALEKFPNDPRILASAAQFETARGDRAKAADYWRASLKAMPPVSPATELAHKLNQADLVQQSKTHGPADLVKLLRPDSDENPEDTGGIPLPSYSHPNATHAGSSTLGPDPYSTGTAPVQLQNNPPEGGAGSGAIVPLTPKGSDSLPAPPPMSLNSGQAGTPDSEATLSLAHVHTGASAAPPPPLKTEDQPVEIGLDTTPALIPLATSYNPAQLRAEATLKAAQKPVDPTIVATQYAPPSQVIASLPQPSSQPEYFERPEGISDDELMKENLPPLRGHYERPAIVRQRDLREQAQMNLSNIEAGYSGWLGGTGLVNHRSGTAGFDSLTALQAPFEASAPLRTGGRLTIVSNPVFLDSGAVTKSPLLPGGVAERLGTAPANAVLNQQNAVGVGGEVQFATENFAASAGYSPWGFLVSNVIARAYWKPGNGPFTFTATRDSVKDSQLSYSGLRDPGSAGPGYSGNVWGGVVSTGGEVQFGKSDPNSGFYFSGGGQHLNGVHVQSNNRIDGDAGAYFRVKEIPDEGSLTVGVNFFGMHYSHNENFFTYGHGGYFSPQGYYLANVPFSFQGHYGPNVHYSAVAAFGLQAFQQDSAPFFPLDNALEVTNQNASYSAQSVVGGNYDFHGELSYHMNDHWYAGGLLLLNNTRDYNNQVVGFFIRWANRPQVEYDSGPTGLYPWDGLRPYLAP
ncbi:MAG: cellulose synthase subunit BcsC-related outer membrane protein [Acidobacteriota bacterium]